MACHHVATAWPAPGLHPEGCLDGSRNENPLPAVQMGGADQVEASQVWRITMQPLHGLYMHCIPRVPAQAPAGTDVACCVASSSQQGCMTRLI